MQDLVYSHIDCSQVRYAVICLLRWLCKLSVGVHMFYMS